MSQERIDQKDLEISICLEDALKTHGKIDSNAIDACMKENDATFFNIQQILAAWVEEGYVIEKDDGEVEYIAATPKD